MKALLQNLRDLGTKRLAALGGVGLVMIGLLGFLVFQGGAPSNTLLYGDLDGKEAGEIVDRLDKAHIAYALRDQGQTILVADDKVASTRLMLAKDGLPSGGSVGYEIFDKGGALTETQFEQTINETRALEGELERSIRLIRGVRNARVHLVLKHRELFSSEEQTAQASVLLMTQGERKMDAENVAAVVNLVSAAVPGLKPESISVIDNHGNVLVRSGGHLGEGDTMQTAEEQRQATEMRLSRAVEDMLASSVGYGHVRVEASVSMNTDHVRETQEKYDPDQQVLRSQQTSSEKSTNTQGAANVSVSNNLPNANAGQPQMGSQSVKQQETNNYEVGKTTRTLVQDQPRVARLSVAVLVDGVSDRDAKGNMVWRPRNAEEIARLTELTKGAVGFDAARGDSVTVASMKFEGDGEAVPAEHQGVFAGWIGSANGLAFWKTTAFLIVSVVVVMFVVRPLSLRKGGGATEEEFQLVEAGGRPAAIMGEAGSEGGRALVSLEGGGRLSGQRGVEEDEMIDINGIDGKIHASSVQRVVALIETHPEESVTTLRSWLLASEEEQV